MLDLHTITLTVNGESQRVLVETTRTLLDVLRDDLMLTGTKCGCNQGVCGSCTVLCDGEPIRACLALAVTMTGRNLLTIEGNAESPTLAVVQAAFVEAGAVQCGFCTPGMIMSAVALLNETPVPSIDQIRAALSGNLCRCTGYMKIIDAVLLAAKRVKPFAAQEVSA
jgi:aerobic-type carbon monoxide dehydrogenase small subunit (CoxS/CutS family)